MKQIIRLAWSYLKYYKKQTMALFLGIVLSCALFTGIGSLQKSGNHAARENARTKSGDWHYTLRCDTDWFEEFEKTYQTGEKEQGYCVEQVGLLTMRKVIEEPYEIELDYAEEGYLSMMGRTLKEGRYPAEEGEAALDEFTLRNLDIPREIGTTFTLDGETFTLCGIVSEQPSALTQRMQVFVDPTRDYGTNGRFLYVKFEESKDIYRQMSAFADTFGISKKEIAANWELVEWLKNGTRINAADIQNLIIIFIKWIFFPCHTHPRKYKRTTSGYDVHFSLMLPNLLDCFARDATVQCHKIHSILCVKTDHIDKISGSQRIQIPLIVDHGIIDWNSTDQRRTLTGQLSSKWNCISMRRQIHDGMCAHLNCLHHLLHLHIVIFTVS